MNQDSYQQLNNHDNKILFSTRITQRARLARSAIITGFIIVIINGAIYIYIYKIKVVSTTVKSYINFSFSLCPNLNKFRIPPRSNLIQIDPNYYPIFALEESSLHYTVASTKFILGRGITAERQRHDSATQAKGSLTEKMRRGWRRERIMQAFPGGGEGGIATRSAVVCSRRGVASNLKAHAGKVSFRDF